MIKKKEESQTQKRCKHFNEEATDSSKEEVSGLETEQVQDDKKEKRRVPL